MKKFYKKFSASFLLIALAIFSSSASAELQSICIKDLMNSMFQSKIEFKKNPIELIEVNSAEGILRYPKNVDRVAHPEGHLMYGFESEYTKKETAKILEIYGPAPHYNISKEQWLAKSSEERMSWLEIHLGDKPENAVDSGLVKLINEPGYEFLPNTLVHDATGNVEFVLDPVNTLEQWEKEIRLINQRFGTGSMQGMITTPREAFFGSTPKAPTSWWKSPFVKSDSANKEALEANIGWMAFTNEVDAVNALESGFMKVAKDPTIPSVPKFQHEYLGPITLKKQERLNQFITANAEGNKFEKKYLEEIRTTEGSFKYIGSTAYRPDIGGSTRIGFEIRDAHKGTETLIDKMIKNTFYLQESRTDFKVFSKMKAFDSVKDFDKFSPEIQTMLKDVFPTHAIPGEAYTQENKIATEVYRNFAYPMRDWDKIINDFEGLNKTQKTAYARKIEEAKISYVKKLTLVRKDLVKVANPITKDVAAVQIQKAIAEFSNEAAIGPLFQSWHGGTVVNNPAWNTHINSILKETQPFKVAFPDTSWSGTIEERVAQLQTKWPENIKIVKDVKFKSTDLSSEAKRNVVGISLEGLNAENEALLLKDYTDAFAKGTVSFPLGERGGHLHTRLGSKDLDFYFKSDLAVNEYRFSSTRRLEPVVSLSEEEELRLRTHVQISSENGVNTLGKSGYDGVKSSNTKGTLIDNKPLLDNETHNCTSWVCTARIGVDNKPLHEILGARAGFNVYTNPGWWNTYLVAASRKSEKIPFVVYMDREKSLIEVTNLLEEAKTSDFKWDFHLH
jgi:hypothetical protein